MTNSREFSPFPKTANGMIHRRGTVAITKMHDHTLPTMFN